MAGEGYGGIYWVAAPVMNSGQLIGMVVVERMPFLSIHQETLQLFGLLLNLRRCRAARPGGGSPDRRGPVCLAYFGHSW